MPIDRKTRSDSHMQCLTAAQKDAAYAHCQTVSLREAILWLRQQFNIKISKTALARWLQQQRIERLMAADLTDIRDHHQAASLIQDAAETSTPLTIANSVLFANAVFKEFRKPDGQRDENRMIRYMNLALKARDLEIRARSVELECERLHFTAAKKPTLAVVAPDPDEFRKTEEAMALLFGEEPKAFKSDSGLPVVETEYQQSQRLKADSSSPVAKRQA